MKQVAIEAKKRELGKKNVKKVRNEGGIPCVVYGKNIESFCISINCLDFEKKLNAHGMNALFNLKVNSDSYIAMISEIQRDPVSRNIKHIDFHNISLDATVEVTVPIRLEGDCKGVRSGGILEQVMWELDIETLPANVPEAIEVDISNLALEEEIRVGDIAVPEGIAVLSPADEVVALVFAPKSQEEETESIGDEAAAEPQVIKKGKEEKE